jgi:hypothetical protein
MMGRLRTALRNWLGLSDQPAQDAIRPVEFRMYGASREDVRVQAERLDALLRALGVDIVAAPSGTDGDAYIVALQDADLQHVQLLLDAEVMTRELRRLTIRATRDAAEIRKVLNNLTGEQRK